MKTALVVGLVVAVYALVVTLSLSAFVVTLALSAFGPVFGPVLLASFAEYWGVGALFSFSLLFWSFVLATGLVLAAVIVVVWRILQGRCVALRRNG